MKKDLRRLLASACVAAMLMTTPGMIVLADEVPDEMALPYTNEIGNPETIAGDDFISSYGDEEPVPDIKAGERAETIFHDEHTRDFGNEDSIHEREFETGENSDEPIVESYAGEDSSQTAQEQETGAGKAVVGDGVTATFDEETGTVEFYSNGGTLYKDWLNSISNHYALDYNDEITSIKIASGTVYLPENSRYLFASCYNLTYLDLSGFDTSNVTDMSCMFFFCKSLTNLDLSHFNTSNVTDMSEMFCYCSSLTNLDLSSFNTAKVMSMSGMFWYCSSLANLDLSCFDTANVTDMNCMFCDCDSLTNLDVSGFDTSNVTDMNCMFCDCDSLTNLDVSGFDTSNVTDMGEMFYECKNLTNLDVSGFDTSNVTDMSYMFSCCENLTNLELSSFDTSNVTDMRGMFAACKSLPNLELSSFDTSNVTDMRGMFAVCKSLPNLDLSGFVVSNMTEYPNYIGYTSYIDSILYGCDNLTLLKTPKKTDAKIDLPLTMYDESGKERSKIPILSKSITLTIEKPSAKIDFNKASIAGISLSYGYSGKACTPSPTVEVNGLTLKNDIDYTVRYENNKNPGTATVTISGKGNYVGTRIKNFEIVECVSSPVSGKTYQLIPKNNAGTAVCPNSGKMVNNTKIYITNRSSSEAMKFKAIENPDGTWKFINAKCELALAARQNSSTVGADLVLYDQTDEKAQNWTLSKKSDNSFAIINAASGLSIALSNGSAARGTTLGIAKTITTGLQRFYFVETTPVNAQFDGTKTVRPAKNTNYTLNISSSSKTDGANVNLYSFSNTDEKKFRIIYSGGGYYRLVNVNSGLCLTVKGDSGYDGTNVIQSRWAAQSGQRWKIRKNRDGTVTITNALDTVLHLSGNKIADGTNIIAKNASATSAQKWYLK